MSRGPPCPACGETLNAATAIDGLDPPEPGDMSICLYCQAVLTWESGSRFRAATPAEIREFDAMPSAAVARAVARAYGRKTRQ